MVAIIIGSAAAGIIAGAVATLIVKAVGESNQTEEAYRRGYEDGQKAERSS